MSDCLAVDYRRERCVCVVCVVCVSLCVCVCLCGGGGGGVLRCGEVEMGVFTIT